MKRHLGQLIALLCGLALFLISLLYQDPFQVSGFREWFRILSNAALIPGVLLAGISGMMWISGEGLFNGIKYSINSLVARMLGHEKRYASYYDYIRREKKKRPAYPMLLPGVLFLAAAIVFNLLYYC